MNDQNSDTKASTALEQNTETEQVRQETAEFPTNATEISEAGYKEDSESEKEEKPRIETFIPMENSALSNMYRSFVNKSNKYIRTSFAV